MKENIPPYFDQLTEAEKTMDRIFRGRPPKSLIKRFFDELTDLRFENLLDLDRHLITAKGDDAKKMRIKLWTTVAEMAYRRQHEAMKTLGKRVLDLSIESFYSLPSMPYGRESGYEVEEDSFAHAVLSLPYGDPEYIFEWAKLTKHSHLNTDRKHPRVLIEMEGEELKVSSDLPVEFMITGPAIKIPAGVDPQEWVEDINRQVKEACDKVVLEHPQLSKTADYVKPLQEHDGYAVCPPFAISPTDCGVLKE